MLLNSVTLAIPVKWLENLMKKFPPPLFEEPFSGGLVDCVGPLPKTKAGNQYLLMIMWTSTRFPEVITLRNINGNTIV